MRKLFLFTFAVIVTLSSYGGVALSQQKLDIKSDEKMDTNHELFLRYITEHPKYTSYLQSKIKRMFAITFQDCAKIDKVSRLTPKIILTPAFRGGKQLDKLAQSRTASFNDIHPTHGQWIDKNVVEGCGKTTQFNFIATAYRLDELPELFPAINGQTRIDLIDQSNAEKAVSEKISDKLGCFDSAFVLGSRFLGYKKADNNDHTETNEHSGWYERWVVEACNNYHVVNIAALPDADTRFKFVAQLVDEVKNEEDGSYYLPF